MPDLDDLYKERAEWADMESECSETQKYTVVGGFWWHFFEWFKRKFESYRLDVQAEIDAHRKEPRP